MLNKYKRILIKELVLKTKVVRLKILPSSLPETDRTHLSKSLIGRHTKVTIFVKEGTKHYLQERRMKS